MHAKLHKNLFISTCSLHWNIESSWEVCEKPVLWWKTLIYWMDICCRCTLELPLWGNSNVYQQHMLLKLRKPILKYTLSKYHVHWLSSFKHLKLPISIEIPVTTVNLSHPNVNYPKVLGYSKTMDSPDFFPIICCNKTTYYSNFDYPKKSIFRSDSLVPIKENAIKLPFKIRSPNVTHGNHDFFVWSSSIYTPEWFRKESWDRCLGLIDTGLTPTLLRDEPLSE